MLSCQLSNDYERIKLRPGIQTTVNTYAALPVPPVTSISFELLGERQNESWALASIETEGV